MKDEKEINNSVETPIEDENLIVKSPKIYQILTGKSELDEFYTVEAPKFSSDFEALICSNVIMKESVERTVINKKITFFYASPVIESKEFFLEDGVLIKTIEADKLTWLEKTKEEADEALKDRELEVYREILPRLIGQNNNNNNPSGKNLFIE